MKETLLAPALSWAETVNTDEDGSDRGAAVVVVEDIATGTANACCSGIRGDEEGENFGSEG